MGSAYPPGSVLCVRVRNFVSYTRAEFIPGPRLNLVVGPNGTGKSSLVSALVLGLAGRPTSIGHTDSAQHIRAGAESATIDVSLSTGENSPPLVVSRVIRQKGSPRGASEWRINGERVSREAVSSRLATLDIHVDNMCQLLPQDLVSSFAAMSPPELLTATEATIGGKALVALHDDLIAGSAMKETELQNLRAVEKRENDCRSLLEVLRGDATRFRRIRRLTSILHAAESGLRATKHHRLSMERDQLKRRVRAFRDRAVAVDRGLRQAESQVDHAERRTRQHVDEIARSVERAREARTTAQALINTAQERIAAREATAVKVEALVRRRAEHAGQVEEATSRLREVTQRHEAALAADARREAEREALKTEIDDLLREELEIGRAMHPMKQDIANIEAKLLQAHAALESSQRAAQRLGDPAEDLLRRLPDKFSNVAHYRRWTVRALATNQLRRPIYGPIAAEIRVGSAQHAAYLEAVAGTTMLMAFLAQTPEDRDAFLEERERSGVEPPLIMYHVNEEDPPSSAGGGAANKDERAPMGPGDTQRHGPPDGRHGASSGGDPRDLIDARSASAPPLFPHPTPIEDLSPYGFTSYLSAAIVESPPAVLEELCRQCNLHKIPMGSDAIIEHVDEVFRQFGDRGLNLFLSPSSIHRAVSSRWAPGQTSFMLQPLHAAKILVAAASPGTHAAAICDTVQLRGERAALRDRMASLDRRAMEIREHSPRVRAALASASKLIASSTELQVRDATIALEQLRRFDADRETESLRVAASESVASAAAAVEKLHDRVVSEMVDAAHAHTEALLRRSVAAKQLVVARERLEAAAAERKAIDQEMRPVVEAIRGIASAMADLEREGIGLEAGAAPDDHEGPDPETHDESGRQAALLKNLFEALVRRTPEVLPPDSSLSDIIATTSIELGSLSADPNAPDRLDRCERELEGLVACKAAIDERLAALDRDMGVARANWLGQLDQAIAKINTSLAEHFREIGWEGSIKIDEGAPIAGSRRSGTMAARREARSDPGVNPGADPSAPHDYKSYGLEIWLKTRPDAAGGSKRLTLQEQSGGERSVATMLYLMAMQSVSRAPFRVFDEINQGMDVQNEDRLFKILAKQSIRQGAPQYFFITPKLLPTLELPDSTVVHCVFAGGPELDGED